MKKKKQTVKKFFTQMKWHAITLLIWGSNGILSAQTNLSKVKSALTSTSDGLKNNVVEPVITMVNIIAGIVCIVFGVKALIEIFNGRGDAAQTSGKWAGGMLVFTLGIYLVRVLFIN